MTTTRNDMAVLHALKAMETTISQSRPDDGLLDTVRVTIANMEAAMADPVTAAAHRLYDLLSRVFDALDGEEESVKEEHTDLIEEVSHLLDELRPEAAESAAPIIHEYLFDVKLFAGIRVKAKTQAEARQLLKDYVDGTEANLGSWPDGEPILCGVTLDDVTNDAAVEIDGEAV